MNTQAIECELIGPRREASFFTTKRRRKSRLFWAQYRTIFTQMDSMYWIGRNWDTQEALFTTGGEKVGALFLSCTVSEGIGRLLVEELRMKFRNTSIKGVFGEMS